MDALKRLVIVNMIIAVIVGMVIGAITAMWFNASLEPRAPVTINAPQSDRETIQPGHRYTHQELARRRVARQDAERRDRHAVSR